MDSGAAIASETTSEGVSVVLLVSTATGSSLAAATSEATSASAAATACTSARGCCTGCSNKGAANSLSSAGAAKVTGSTAGAAACSKTIAVRLSASMTCATSSGQISINRYNCLRSGKTPAAWRNCLLNLLLFCNLYCFNSKSCAAEK